MYSNSNHPSRSSTSVFSVSAMLEKRKSVLLPPWVLGWRIRRFVCKCRVVVCNRSVRTTYVQQRTSNPAHLLWQGDVMSASEVGSQRLRIGAVFVNLTKTHTQTQSLSHIHTLSHTQQEAETYNKQFPVVHHTDPWCTVSGSSCFWAF